MSSDLASKFLELPFVHANVLSANNFKICEDICKESGVYINFPDWNRSQTQTHFQLTINNKAFTIQVVKGDMLHETTDCIVNAANENLEVRVLPLVLPKAPWRYCC